MLKRISVLGGFMLIAASGFAQTDFSGNWGLKEKAHVEGPEYANALPSVLKVQQRADSLVIESTSIGADSKDVITRQAVPINGKQSSITSSNSKRKLVRSLAWSVDKKSLTLTTVFYVPENDNEVDFTRVEIWSLVNGQLEVKKRSVETRSETWAVNGVFVKQ